VWINIIRLIYTQ